MKVSHAESEAFRGGLDRGIAIWRKWYEKEAYEQMWSARTLQRNVSSQYYYRMLQTQRQDLVENEMKELTAE